MRRSLASSLFLRNFQQAVAHRRRYLFLHQIIQQLAGRAWVVLFVFGQGVCRFIKLAQLAVQFDNFLQGAGLML